jgi:hypothetical protein
VAEQLSATLWRLDLFKATKVPLDVARNPGTRLTRFESSLAPNATINHVFLAESSFETGGDGSVHCNSDLASADGDAAPGNVATRPANEDCSRFSLI